MLIDTALFNTETFKDYADKIGCSETESPMGIFGKIRVKCSPYIPKNLVIFADKDGKILRVLDLSGKETPNV